MDIRVEYERPRLWFEADRIDPLDLQEAFRIITPDGTFEMTKEQFLTVFGHIPKTVSYRDRRHFHYKTPPQKANQFRVGSVAPARPATTRKKVSDDPDFRMPGRGGVSGRTSSITAAFYQAITPAIYPTEIEIDRVIEILGMVRENCVCAYCGDPMTEWDHFRPTVRGKMPTGFITEIYNLVPACGKCNQSKGNKDWRIWIMSDAPRSPKKRVPEGLSRRMEALERYEAWSTPLCTRLNYEEIFGAERWSTYSSLLRDAVSHLEEAQKEASQLLLLSELALSKNTGPRD